MVQNYLISSNIVNIRQTFQRYKVTYSIEILLFSSIQTVYVFTTLLFESAL